MKIKNLTFLVISILVIAACRIDSAHPEQAKKLVIVSDYLTIKDSSLFADFVQQEQVEIQIIHKDVNEIIKTFKVDHYNTGFDVIMLNSLYDVKRLSNSKYLNTIDELETKGGFISKKYNYAGIGIDPYIIAYNPDTTNYHRTYSDLKSIPFHTDLSNKEMIPMLAGILSKLNKVKSYQWIRDLKSQQYKPTPYSKVNSYLTTLSDYQSLKTSDSVYMYLKAVHYPNQSANGAFYNLKTMSIVSQAENYTTAKEFISYHLDAKNNKRFNDKIGTLSIDRSKNKVRLHNVNSEELLQYYGMTERILNKLD